MFSILRIAIGIIVGVLLAVLLYKYKRTKFMFFGMLIIIVVALITVIGFVPFENLAYTFKSPESVYRYYLYGENSVDLVVPGKECDFVIGTKKDTSTYLIVPKNNNGWKIGTGLNTKRIVQKSYNGITINVYHYKNTNDYFISVLGTSGGKLNISDDYNTKFNALEKNNEVLQKTFVTYYAHIPKFNSPYSIVVDGNEIIL